MSKRWFSKHPNRAKIRIHHSIRTCHNPPSKSLQIVTALTSSSSGDQELKSDPPVFSLLIVSAFFKLTILFLSSINTFPINHDPSKAQNTTLTKSCVGVVYADSSQGNLQLTRYASALPCMHVQSPLTHVERSRRSRKVQKRTAVYNEFKIQDKFLIILSLEMGSTESYSASFGWPGARGGSHLVLHCTVLALRTSHG